MKIIGNKKIRIYIYPNDHPPPHCHVRFKDGSEVSVDLPLIIPRYGATISREVYELVRKNLNKLCSNWEDLNNNKKNKNRKRKNDKLE